jgi:hypothetical protein
MISRSFVASTAFTWLEDQSERKENKTQAARNWGPDAVMY